MGKDNTIEFKKVQELGEEKEKIESIKRDLILNGALYSLMSGSGGSVFGIFNKKKDAKKCEEKLKEKYNKVVTFETI